MSKILISYRREDSAHVTGRIYDRLTQQFGRTAVFKDVDSIPLGIDFRTYLDQQVAKCDVFLAVIGRNWMKPQGQRGKSRLADPADFVRLEIEAALKRQIPVIPVLVEGASIPAVDRLPISLQGLSYRNGIAVRPDPDFHRDMDRLIEHLRVQIEREQEGLPPLEVPPTASSSSLTTEAPSFEGEPPGQESVEVARQPSGLESQPALMPPQEEAPISLFEADLIVRDGGTTEEEAHSEVERVEQENVEATVPPSRFDSHQPVEQGEEEPLASTPTSRATTDGNPSNSLGGLGLIVVVVLLVGAATAFLMLQSKPSLVYSPPMLEKKEESVAQVNPPSFPVRPSEALVVPKMQKNAVEKPVSAKQRSVSIPEMVQVSPGSFMMGGSTLRNETPIHSVHFTKPFAIAKYETTFDEYDRFALATGRRLSDDRGRGRGQKPVDNVTWDDANAYAIWLSQQTGNRYRLPTEAEWEYAARSGGKDEIWAGTSDEGRLKFYAVYEERYSDAFPSESVGKRKPNGLDLYDMSGNVAEWVEDCWHTDYSGAPTDGSAWIEGGYCSRRVIRGGSWYSDPEGLRTSNRHEGNITGTYGYGFRLAQDVDH